MGKGTHGDDGDQERQRAEQLVVQLVPQSRKGQPEGKDRAEQEAAENCALEGPPSEHHRHDRDEAAPCDDSIVEPAHLAEQKVGTAPARAQTREIY